MKLGAPMTTKIFFNDILDQFDPSEPDYFEKAAKELARVCEATPDSIVVLDVGRTFGLNLEEGQSLRLHTTRGDIDMVKGHEHKVGTIDNFLGMTLIQAAQHEERTLNEQELHL